MLLLEDRISWINVLTRKDFVKKRSHLVNIFSKMHLIELFSCIRGKKVRPMDRLFALEEKWLLSLGISRRDDENWDLDDQGYKDSSKQVCIEQNTQTVMTRKQGE